VVLNRDQRWLSRDRISYGSIERIAMLWHGIPDIRMLYDNDVRFLAQMPA
jgi:hypothetical protein